MRLTRKKVLHRVGIGLMVLHETWTNTQNVASHYKNIFSEVEKWLYYLLQLFIIPAPPLPSPPPPRPPTFPPPISSFIRITKSWLSIWIHHIDCGSVKNSIALILCVSVCVRLCGPLWKNGVRHDWLQPVKDKSHWGNAKLNWTCVDNKSTFSRIGIISLENCKKICSFRFDFKITIITKKISLATVQNVFTIKCTAVVYYIGNMLFQRIMLIQFKLFFPAKKNRFTKYINNPMMEI